MTRTGRITWLVVLVATTFVAGCGPVEILQRAVLDTPEHHVASGQKLLAVHKFEDALREFARAHEMDPSYAPAYVGLARAHARLDHFELARASLRSAEKRASSEEQTMDALVAGIEICGLGRDRLDRRWRVLATEYFDQAVFLAPENPAPYYAMARVAEADHDFDEAARLFEKAASLKGDAAEKARQELARIRKIQKARPLSSTGRQVATKDEITRADMAALVVAELGPTRTWWATGSAPACPVASDVAGHPEAEWIRRVLEAGIDGLGVYPDQTFGPDKLLTRADYARIMTDILSRARGGALPEEVRDTSRWDLDDVPDSSDFRPAVLICLETGIMEPAGEDRFDPTGPVSGADAVLGLRRLKQWIGAQAMP